jgi:hypothetical protein
MICIRLFLPSSLLLVTGLGCGVITDPGPASRTAGTYVLESVDGCAPGPAAAECFPRPSWVLAGEMVLQTDGSVTRTMHYEFPSDPAAGTMEVSGTYRRRGNSVDFALVETVGDSRYVWRPRALLSEHRLTLRYPHPADGETVEVFSRLQPTVLEARRLRLGRSSRRLRNEGLSDARPMIRH